MGHRHISTCPHLRNDEYEKPASPLHKNREVKVRKRGVRILIRKMTKHLRSKKVERYEKILASDPLWAEGRVPSFEDLSNRVTDSPLWRTSQSLSPSLFLFLRGAIRMSSLTTGFGFELTFESFYSQPGIVRRGIVQWCSIDQSKKRGRWTRPVKLLLRGEYFTLPP